MAASTAIPFVDLVNLHRGLEEEFVAVLRQTLGSGMFVGGPMVTAFEEAFARFCETACCVGVSSGTDALRFALMAAGVGRGDAVLTVANTFIATAEAISQAGAVPEFVDVDEGTSNLDASKLRDCLEGGCRRGAHGEVLSQRSGRRVRAIVPVHLYGQMADMDAILEVAREYGLMVIEDACQAHGAEYFSAASKAWQRAGSMGRAAAFSFYPGKNLGACGEGGAVTTNDEEIARHVRRLRDHGQEKKYYHLTEGYNGRLDAIQAGILLAKLPHLAEWNRKRREVAARYFQLVSGCAGVVLPDEPPWSKSVYHLFVARLQHRNEIAAALAAAGIGTGIHYPVPLHRQPAYSHLKYGPEALPVTDRLAGTILSLPMYPDLQAEQQARVVEAMSRLCAAAA